MPDARPMLFRFLNPGVPSWRVSPSCFWSETQPATCRSGCSGRLLLCCTERRWLWRWGSD